MQTNGSDFSAELGNVTPHGVNDMAAGNGSMSVSDHGTAVSQSCRSAVWGEKFGRHAGPGPVLGGVPELLQREVDTTEHSAFHTAIQRQIQPSAMSP